MEQDQKSLTGRIWYHEGTSKPSVPAGGGSFWKRRGSAGETAFFVIADRNGKLWKVQLTPHEEE